MTEGSASLIANRHPLYVVEMREGDFWAYYDIGAWNSGWFRLQTSPRFHQFKEKQNDIHRSNPGSLPRDVR